MEYISTGYKDLDLALHGGFLTPSFVVIGARPAMGKTSLMLNLASNFSKNGHRSLWFSLEETKERLSQRLKDISGKKNCIDIYDQNHKFDDLLENINIYVEDTNSKIVFIDYLQLLYPKDDKFYESSSNISHTLKNLSKQLGITIIVASQLNRKVEERTGHRPMMTDLRDSGSIEEDADQVILLLRREYYDWNDRPGMAELIIAKNRRCLPCSVHLNFSRDSTVFSEYQLENT